VKNTSTILIEVLLKTIDKMGIKKTIQVLEVSHSYSDDSKQLVQLIILNSCNHFGITDTNLKIGRDNNPNRTNAIGVCSVLLLRMVKLSQREISDLLHKDTTLINKYIRKFQNLDPNFKGDAEVLRKMEEIRLDVLKQLEINK
jgi:hypothetical protein